MGVLEDFNREERLKDEIWEKLPDYEALGMTEDDIDLRILEEEEYEKRYNELNSKLVIPVKKDTSNIKALLKENILDAYDTLDPEEQSAFWHGLIKAIYIDDDFNITSIDFF